MTTRRRPPGRSERTPTHLELFLRSRRIKPAQLAREVPCSRQYLGRVRFGTADPTRAMIARIVSAARRISLEPLRAEDLFELTIDETVPRDEAEGRLQARAAAYTRARAAAEELWRATVLRRPAAWLGALTKNDVTPDLVRVLIFDAERKVDSNPRRAFTILETADALSMQMKGVPPELLAALRGRTLLDRAYTLRQLGRYADALPVLDAAEEQYEQSPRCHHEVAMITYERAAILFQMEDLSSATRAARRAGNLFTLLGDRRRAAKTQIVLGCILCESGELEAARDTFAGVVAPLEALDDAQTLASVYLNLGTTETRLENPVAARNWLQEALAAFTRLGVRGEAVRARWNLAEVEVLYGDREEGLQQQRQVRADFAAMQMEGEAAMVALQLIEHLLQDEEKHEAAAISREIVATFQRSGSGSPASAVRAVEYLERATRDGTADPALARGIRRFLERSLVDQQHEFDPENAVGRS